MLSCLRIEPAQFDAGVGGGELPANGHFRLIASLLPGGDFSRYLGDAAEPTAQALAGAQRLGEVEGGAPLGDGHLALSGQRFDAEEYVAGSVPLVLIVLAFRGAGGREQAAPGRGVERLGALVHADP